MKHHGALLGYAFILAVILSLSLFPAGCGSSQEDNSGNTDDAGLVETGASRPDAAEQGLTSVPLEQALANGLPTIAEFGRGTCIPCKQMKPILEGLAKEYEGRANVLIISIDERRDLTARYRIMAIPTQVFLDSGGREITRHMGFYAREDIIARLQEMGIE